MDALDIGLLLIDLACADLDTNDFLVIFEGADDFFFGLLFLEVQVLHPVLLDDFVAVNVLKFADHVVLCAQELDFDMCAVIVVMALVPGLSEAHLTDVADRVLTQLVDDALHADFTHGHAIHLLTHVAKLADHGAAIHTKSNWLQFLQIVLLQYLVAWILLILVNLLAPDLHFLRKPLLKGRNFLRGKSKKLCDVACVVAWVGIMSTFSCLQIRDLVFETFLFRLKIIDLGLQFIVQVFHFVQVYRDSFIISLHLHDLFIFFGYGTLFLLAIILKTRDDLLVLIDDVFL